ncbi:hypothetical protein [Acidiphilium acidophilum]|uniref:hypothetical protein n=1 Tax=Acidiphilium acidophilum TaxID=76588 RepID=UPI002E8E76F2|nr:hypothetical protein [Acidiphilium acidophilum]
MDQIVEPPGSHLTDERRQHAEFALATLVEHGDLDRLVGLARLVGSAQDATNDDTVGRFAAIAGEGLDLLDKVNRSGIARALPAISALVEHGDLDRIVGLARLIGSAQDATGDETVARFAAIAGEGLDLLDKVNRSGLSRALPAISALVDHGDLDRIVGLARLVGSAQDAMSDEMVSRMAAFAGDALCIADRLVRNRVVDRMMALLNDESMMSMLDNIGPAIDSAVQKSQTEPAPSGGLSGLWSMMKKPETQKTLQFMLNIGTALRQPSHPRS